MMPIRGCAVMPAKQSAALKQNIKIFDVFIAACFVAIRDTNNKVLRMIVTGESTSIAMPKALLNTYHEAVEFQNAYAQLSIESNEKLGFCKINVLFS